MTGVIYARYSSDNQREESIDGQVRECLAYAEKNGIQIVETYIDRARVYQLQDQENTTVPLLKKQLAETEKSIENVLNAIEQGIITPSTKQRLEELEQRKQNLQIEVAKENIKKPVLTKEQILFWLHRFRNIDTDNIKHRKRLVDSFVNSVVLYDDRIEFFFNYKDGAKTLTLDELSKSSDLLNSAPPKGAVKKHPKKQTGT